MGIKSSFIIKNVNVDNKTIKINGDGQLQVKKEVEAPIGTILAWVKNLTGTPTLSDKWVECNGQTITDPESPYYNKSIPNLNNNHYFLRGNSTSGGTGGSSSHNLKWYGRGGGSGSAQTVWKIGDNGYTSGSHYYNIPTIPPYYNVVWIIKIK